MDPRLWNRGQHAGCVEYRPGGALTLQLAVAMVLLLALSGAIMEGQALVSCYNL
jgi:hypothetical protein